jgi:hypothetical protein
MRPVRIAASSSTISRLGDVVMRRSEPIGWDRQPSCLPLEFLDGIMDHVPAIVRDQGATRGKFPVKTRRELLPEYALNRNAPLPMIFSVRSTH